MWPMVIGGRSTRELRAAAAGEVLEHGDAGYDEARRTFNALIERRPAVIVRARSTADAVEAVQFARAHELPIAIRGGGHSVAGHSVADGAVVVDLSLMRDVVVDPVARIAHVAGGAQWLDVDGAAHAFGLATTGGTFGDTGVGGLALGGGLGWLMGVAGLTCDNLVGAEVVTATGEIIEVDAEREPGLLWALRGGGGNFGIVTRFDLRLHPVGEVYGGYLYYAPDDAAAGLRAFRDLTAQAPDELVAMPVLTTRAEGAVTGLVLALELCYAGSREAAEAAIGPLRAAAPVMHDQLGPLTYPDMQALAQMPFGLRHYWKGHFLRELPDPLIDRLVDHWRGQPGIGAMLFEPIHGRAKRVADDSAAFGQRGAAFNVSALGIWQDPDLDATGIAWARGAAELLEPHSHTGGGYVNYMSADEPIERVRSAFGPVRFARLVELKRRYDPDNLFRFNHNIPPTA
jgi:FAD/FMN-containing dehydrogenase